MAMRSKLHECSIRISTSALRCFAVIAAALFLCAPLNSTEQFDSDAVIGHLSTTIKLYRTATAEIQTGGAPSDVIYQENERSLIADVVRLGVSGC